jgi:hydroxyacylglutathione hydrolase
MQEKRMSKFVQFNSKTENPHFETVMDIDPSELATLKENVKLIDVRQPEEYVGELGHIPGAELIVLNTLPEHLDKLPKDQTVVFVCLAGGRSAKAAAFAKMNGYEHVYNMQGGMQLWNHLQLPVER